MATAQLRIYFGFEGLLAVFHFDDNGALDRIVVGVDGEDTGADLQVFGLGQGIGEFGAFQAACPLDRIGDHQAGVITKRGQCAGFLVVLFFVGGDELDDRRVSILRRIVVAEERVVQRLGAGDLDDFGIIPAVGAEQRNLMPSSRACFTILPTSS